MQNQFIRNRTVVLPEDCGIDHSDITEHGIIKMKKVVVKDFK